MRLALASVALLLLPTSCTRTADTGIGADAGTETGTDTGSETGTDAGSETGTDTGSETGTDAGSETGTDAGSETGTDAGSETGSDGSDTGQEGYEFVCNDDGLGLSAVDVLQASGEHQTFLSLLGRYDSEALDILADPVLADKTVWAPTDAAFAAISDTLSPLSDAEIKAILGYHITPPRREPDGYYPIITPQFLIDGGWIVHQTRTGILTESDQRILTKMAGPVLAPTDELIVEDATILPTSWCTQTGSVFSIDAVITDASPEPWKD
jgi:uncharacterized surface protein with fasciclin (FAS1) repeats